ncbi:hypothetical protein DPMN_071802 [Dreissena polymorpha]|uniref:Uncharacterized protein n=1 Tax=Dreissena polymorpha TaxID=45954 RepID=A0A9D3Z3K9_DREPO|nr:hypothetical protein DPMN_071802 [Dreissena polymorpha]
MTLLRGCERTRSCLASHQQGLTTRRRQEHRLAGADRSSIFFLKVKGLSFSITKEGGLE